MLWSKAFFSEIVLLKKSDSRKYGHVICGGNSIRLIVWVCGTKKCIFSHHRKLMEKQLRNKGREGREEGGRRSKDGREEGDKQGGGKYKEMNQLKVGATPLKGSLQFHSSHTAAPSLCPPQLRPDSNYITEPFSGFISPPVFPK